MSDHAQVIPLAGRRRRPAHRRPPSSFDELPLMLTIAEAAEVLRISRSTAYKLAEEWRRTGGKSGLPHVRLGRLLVRRCDLWAMVSTAG